MPLAHSISSYCRSLVRWLLPAAMLVAVAAGCRTNADEAGRRDVMIFAAASLTDALEAVADSFEAAHPRYRVVVNVAATSVLARQIDEGARADVFFSANLEWMRFLRAQGRLDGPVGTLLGNRLVAIAPRGADVPASPEAFVRADRVALADPEHVPAGIYARQALECLDLWASVAPRVVPMLDVRAALLAVAEAAADVGVVYASDLRDGGRVQSLFVLPERCQPAVRYAAAVPATAQRPEAGRLFLAFADAPERSALWASYGFLTDVDDTTDFVP